LCFRDFAEKNPERNFVILRHDIDFSPDAALRMAELEADMGIKATYFLLFSSPYYNLLGSEYIRFPKRLNELGHEVALHYDVAVLEALESEDPHAIVSQQSGILSRLAGSEIISIAMHNPSSSGVDPIRETGFINAYDHKYTKDISYFSDSCGAWRDEFVEHLENDNFPMQMQLLIHPIFWGNTYRSRWERLDRFTTSRIDTFLMSAKKIKEEWRQHVGVIQHDTRRWGAGSR
jgi:hypothetical protein